MKNQLTVFIAFLVSGYLLMAQASETKATPDVADVPASELTSSEETTSEPQQTPDVINEVVEDEKPRPISADELPSAPSVMSPQEKALFQAAHAGRLAEVQAQVQKGVSVNFVDQEKRTALILAANKGHTAVVEYLYSKGADINASDKSGMTALLYTAKRSFNETAAFLLGHGAEVNVQTRKKGLTALMLASGWGNMELVQMLLDKGADPAIRDKFGWTAAGYAEKRNHSEIVKLLSGSQVPKSE